MSNRGNIPNIPKGWTTVNVIDIWECEQSEDETYYQTCIMCNNDRIWWVHIFSHPEVDSYFEVGCVCAEKMAGDFTYFQKQKDQ